MIDEIEALLTITIPIVLNSQTGSNSCIPNGWFRGWFLKIFSLSCPVADSSVAGAYKS